MLIWENLGWSELKIVRGVCRALQTDIDLRIGVDAVLDSTFFPESTWKLLSSLATYFGFGNDKVKGYLNWFNSVKVRSLLVQHMENLPLTLEPTELLNSRAQFILQKLVLKVDGVTCNESSVKIYTKMLELCNGIRVLEILLDFQYQLTFDNTVIAKRLLHQVFKEILQNLTLKTKLKDLTVNFPIMIRSDMISFLMPEFALQNVPLLPANAFNLLRLRTLKLCMSQLTAEEAVGWKILLDNQNQLESLDLQIGIFSYSIFPIMPDRNDFNIYARALEKSALSLKHLTLKLVNEKQRHIPIQNILSLFHLRESRLETLNISIPSERNSGIKLIRNFPALQLENMKELKMHCVFLSHEDLIKIFMETPNLKHCTLDFWNPLGNEDEHFGHSNGISSIRGINLVVLLCIILPERRLEYLYIQDLCWSHLVHSTIVDAVWQAARSSGYSYTSDRDVGYNTLRLAHERIN